MTPDIETGGTLGEGSENTPVNYPRSDEERDGGGCADPAACDCDGSVNGGIDEGM
jgi:hypothetical protein